MVEDPREGLGAVDCGYRQRRQPSGGTNLVGCIAKTNPRASYKSQEADGGPQPMPGSSGWARGLAAWPSPAFGRCPRQTRRRLAESLFTGEPFSLKTKLKPKLN